jgi:5-methylthioadenosine/S-adenosylhomocysteine deaminase
MIPQNDLLSNIVYSASGESVTHTIVGGRVVMEEGHIPGQDTIIDEARFAAEELRSGGD